jgi:hypothetical protein
MDIKPAMVRIENPTPIIYNEELSNWFISLGFEINHKFEDIGDGNQTEVMYISRTYDLAKEDKNND